MMSHDSSTTPDAAAEPLVIRITAGSGSGPTTLAAFDNALRAAGVADHNLIRLSSIIPPGSVVEVCPPEEQLRGEFGDVLYCVYAVAFATEWDEEAWSGVGWSRAADGRGLFVEHSGHAEEHVRTLITSSLDDMNEGRAQEFTFEDMVLSSAQCDGLPACSIVLAAYRTEGWGSHA